MRAKVALAAAGSLLLSVGAVSALAAPTISGNRRAIAIARAEARAYTRVSVETYTETGDIQMNDAEGRSSYLTFSWGQAKLKRGWVWVREHSIVALRHGRVLWWRDDLTPPACRRAGICHQIPVDLVSERRGAFWAFGDAARHTCYGRLRGTQPVMVGDVWDRVLGHYSAPAFGRRTVRLTYTFPLGEGKTAREVDTLSSRTHLLESGHEVLPGGHTVRFSTGYPRKAPGAPRIANCRA